MRPGVDKPAQDQVGSDCVTDTVPRPTEETMHDIRNALATISANLAFVARRCRDDESMEVRIASAMRAVARTNRLLATLPHVQRQEE